jgi:hypothetical protein
MAKRSPGSSTMQAMAEIECEDELEYEDDWGTIASEEERADDDLIFVFLVDRRIVFALQLAEAAA